MILRGFFVSEMNLSSFRLDIYFKVSYTIYVIVNDSNYTIIETEYLIKTIFKYFKNKLLLSFLVTNYNSERFKYYFTETNKEQQ